jgi:hypothetical protein
MGVGQVVWGGAAEFDVEVGVYRLEEVSVGEVAVVGW